MKECGLGSITLNRTGFELTQSQQELIRSRLDRIERSMIDSQTSIGQLCKVVLHKTAELRASNDPIPPILRTALVINWPESAMKERYSRFRHKYPHIQTLESLCETIRRVEPMEFCVDYLNINANPDKPEANPKYKLLETLAFGFQEYYLGLKSELTSEMTAMRHWADRVDITKLKRDPIGSLKWVGPGVVENIRLNLGYSVIKPDRHVIRVMENVVLRGVPRISYEELAEQMGLDRRYLDCLLFEFGKATNDGQLDA